MLKIKFPTKLISWIYLFLKIKKTAADSTLYIIWGSAGASTMHKLVILQKRAVRIITRSHFRAASNPLFVRLNLLKMTDIHRFQVAIFVFKFIHFLIPVSCSAYFSLNTAGAGLCYSYEQYFCCSSFSNCYP